jgi:hypothetical protein
LRSSIDPTEGNETEEKQEVEDEHTRADENRSRAREHSGRRPARGECEDQPDCEWQGGQWQSNVSYLIPRNYEDLFTPRKKEK